MALLNPRTRTDGPQVCHIEKEGKRKDVVAPPRNAYRGMGDSSFRNFLSFPTVVMAVGIGMTQGCPKNDPPKAFQDPRH